jgi:hypothetical protein
MNNEAPEVLPRNSVVGFQIVVQHVGADDQVTRVERVDLVPALVVNKLCQIRILLQPRIFISCT